MKLYTLGHGVYGSVVVTANSKEEAYEKMLTSHPCTEERSAQDVEEHEIDENFNFSNLGDL